ncbi:DUF1326 domain-containing protein [Aquibaculum sediminis]|uniref:DUF1326 domain-containing protein n=1 Tax=Aquibaculum sediminis TaxID=3231907 RepID=UPI003451E5C2
MASWNLKGFYAEACTCEGACPCVYTEKPTGGTCTGLVGWHIDEGEDGGVRLEDLNVALALHSPGRMTDGNWRVALYLDDRADDQQRAALQRIFSGAAGGHPANLSPLIGEVTEVAPARIRFEQSEGGCRLDVGSVAEADMQAIEGLDGGKASISGHPLAVAPGFPATVAKSSTFKLQAGDIRCDVTGRTAFYSPFAYEG